MNSNTVARSVIALWIALFAVGCASTSQKIAASDPHSENTTPGKSKVFVYRPSKMTGAAVGFEILDNDTLVGRVGPGGLLCWERDPGFVTIEARSSSMGTAYSAYKQFYALAGKLYYLQAEISLDGLTSANLKIDSVDENRAKQLVRRKVK